MANISAVRDALIKLMRATEKGKATRPEDRAFRTQYEDVGDYGEPTVSEVVNQSPTKAGAIEKAVEGPAGNDPWGTFPADPDSAAIRAARGEANYVQGSDPLGNLDPHGSPRWRQQSKIGDRTSPLTKDPSRLPADPVKFDQPAPSMSRDLDTFPDEGTYYGRPPDEVGPKELQGSEQVFFENLMRDAKAGRLALDEELATLRRISPEAAILVEREAKEITSMNPLYDEIPF
jgi:hypothetical protein